MTSKWLSTTDTCRALGVSESTLRRRSKQGKIESKLEDGQRFYLVQDDEQVTSERTQADLIEQLQSQIQNLRQQLEDRERQIQNLQTQIEEKDQKYEGTLKQQNERLEEANRALAEASHRHDTVVMQMTRLLEYHQQPFWRRLFSRKALPPPVDENVMDMEPGGNKAKE